MKGELKKYIFEIIVIFIGITVSFLFENWRQNKQQQQTSIRQLTLLKNDLGRSKSWIEGIDSIYSNTVSEIVLFRNGSSLSEEDLATLLFDIFNNSLDFPLNNLSPYLTDIVRLSEVGKKGSTSKIITYVAYIQTLIRLDYELNRAIANYNDNQIWPKLYQSEFANKVIDAEKSWNDSTIVWDEKAYTIDGFSGLENDLSFVEFKLRKILIVHEALKSQIERLKKELSKVE
jgi:hypothetical protein